MNAVTIFIWNEAGTIEMTTVQSQKSNTIYTNFIRIFVINIKNFNKYNALDGRLKYVTKKYKVNKAKANEGTYIFKHDSSDGVVVILLKLASCRNVYESNYLKVTYTIDYMLYLKVK